jgi:hypothetical protein
MTIGFNLAGLQFVRSRLIEMKTGEVYEREGFEVDEDSIRQRLEAGQAKKRKAVV